MGLRGEMAEFFANKFAGIHNRLPSDEVPSGFSSVDIKGIQAASPEFFTQAENVFIDDTESLNTRYGTTLALDGSITSLWFSGDDLYAVRNSQLVRVNRDFSYDVLLNQIGDFTTFYRCGDFVYFTDGESVNGSIYAGTVHNWGIPYPRAPLNISEITGLLNGGTYQFAITYEDQLYRESGADIATSIEVSDGAGVRITWNTAIIPAYVDTVVIYATRQNGSILQRVASVPAQVGTYDFVSANHLMAQLDTQFLAPPITHIDDMTLYKGIMYVSDGVFLHASKALRYELFDFRDFLSIDNSKITMLEGLANVMFVGTEKGAYVLRGNTLSDLEIDMVIRKPVLQGSSTITDSTMISSGKSNENVVMFVAGDNIFIGSDDGNVVAVTDMTYSVAAGVKATATVTDKAGGKQYVVFNKS